MNTKFTSKSVKLPGPLRGFIEKGLKNIEKVSGNIIDAEVTLSEVKKDLCVEINLKTKQNSYHSKEKNQILKQAIRSALYTLKVQVKKDKEKLNKEKKRKTRRSSFKNFFFSSPPIETEDEKQREQITISNNYSKKPITVEEALFFLRESGENAFAFANTETNLMSVVFYDNKKNISIIEVS